MRRLGDILELKDADGALASRAIAGLAFDSRKIGPGDLFFALSGAKDDGLKHVGEALAKGAAAVVAERRTDIPGAAFVKVADARAALAHAAARFYPRQPETIVAVTGTSGKTSVAAFVRQIWQALGLESASLGTLGVVSRPLTVYGSLTTPDPIALHRTPRPARRAAASPISPWRPLPTVSTRSGSTACASRRARSPISSRDHMDYHATVEDYLAAKLRLFRDLLPDGAPAVVDADSAIAPRVIAAARARGLEAMTVGRNGETIRLVSAARDRFASILDIEFGGRRRASTFPLPGDFQISNALVAAGLCVATGGEADAVFQALQRLRGAPGRLERVGEVRGAAVFVDYAHKPDALEKALQALRPYVARPPRPGVRLRRRPRPRQAADHGRNRGPPRRIAIVTDDNPRSEDPAAIRAAILAAAPRRSKSATARAAIRAGIAMLGDGDALISPARGMRPARSSARSRYRSPTPTKRARR